MEGRVCDDCTLGCGRILSSLIAFKGNVDGGGAALFGAILALGGSIFSGDSLS